MNTKTISVTELHRDANAVIRSIREEGDVICITQDGRPAVAMLDYEQYEALVAHAEQDGWPPGFFEETYGALADVPLSRPDQGNYERRNQLQ